ncbi:flippase-like domain-containing protein [Pseudanabaena sp. FACHB-1277]|uniref:Flippase-like domain-containing protein n=1 Tax=Pseudanabaena cinerea FACHB-1277 TaxID=2949581 RepID=A0A926UXF0_9CYAN|nr:lysylphosphatidylglycerol synthase transmembrane domain-containing protein [Pseudanabaena cinerea]MBD2152683.1 flippase-like domain-containing protein [Pseudanabaena cinerea FACHB-1277]
MKNKIFLVLGWLISLIFLYFALHGLSWSLVIASFAKVSFLTPILMIGTYCLGFVIRALRWKFLLPHGIPIADSLGAVVLGYAANNILPARLGELVRAQAIGRKCEISRSLALASIFVERIFDGLVLTGLLYLGIRGQDIPNWALSVGVLGLSIFGGALCLVLILAFTRSLWEAKIKAFPSSKLNNILGQFAKGFTLIGRNAQLPFTILGLTILVWLVECIMFYIAIQSFDIKVPTTAPLFVMGLINLGILVPAAPGYLGAFQYFGVLALSPWQVNSADALASVILIHACQYLPITLWGAFYLRYFGFSSIEKLRIAVK